MHRFEIGQHRLTLLLDERLQFLGISHDLAAVLHEMPEPHSLKCRLVRKDKVHLGVMAFAPIQKINPPMGFPIKVICQLLVAFPHIAMKAILELLQMRLQAGRIDALVIEKTFPFPLAVVGAINILMGYELQDFIRARFI